VVPRRKVSRAFFSFLPVLLPLEMRLASWIHLEEYIIHPLLPSRRSAHLRQSLLLSRTLSPEISHLFNTALLNRAGKIKALTSYEGVMDKVPRGVRQVWTRFECEDVSLEEEKRFEWFTQKVRFPVFSPFFLR
jgi:hypothetical protein